MRPVMAAAGATVNAPVAQLCLGSGPAELNLRTVLLRINELIRSIDGLLMEIQQHGAHWMAFLDKLAVINLTHMQILQEVRPLLRQYTVYPKFVDNPGIENALPEMLASRLLPEQVEQEAVWKAQLPGGLAALAAQPNVCLDYADSQVVELQELVGWLTNSLAHISNPQEPAVNPTPPELPVGVLDPKGRVRKEVDARSRQIALAAAAVEKQWTKVGSELVHTPQPRPPPPGAGQKRRRPGTGPEPTAAAGEDASTVEQQAEAAADSLIARIMSGEAWPSYRGMAAAQPAAAAAPAVPQ